MTYEIPSDRDYKELLLYWIRERYAIYRRKEDGLPKPWSTDTVFRTTYFCNVHRENDRVTKWIRNYYSKYVDHPMFEYNIVLARFLNWPVTLEKILYRPYHNTYELKNWLNNLSSEGKIWGGAYIITTHGQPMSKIDYLVDQVLSDFMKLNSGNVKLRDLPNLDSAWEYLMLVDGIGSFLAAQIVADLKNTSKHPLSRAPDWYTFVAPGPGSLRGASWFKYGLATGVSVPIFPSIFRDIREYVDANWPAEVPKVCNQDLQNCLCEFDKYCRVLTGSGRSKRGYNG